MVQLYQQAALNGAIALALEAPLSSELIGTALYASASYTARSTLCHQLVIHKSR